MSREIKIKNYFDRIVTKRIRQYPVYVCLYFSASLNNKDTFLSYNNSALNMSNLFLSFNELHALVKVAISFPRKGVGNTTLVDAFRGKNSPSNKSS